MYTSAVQGLVTLMIDHSHQGEPRIILLMSSVVYMCTDHGDDNIVTNDDSIDSLVLVYFRS